MRAATAAPPRQSAGASSYFTPPSDGLDPNLFSGTALLQGVREWLLSTGYGALNAGFRGAHTWATFWAAGSGVTYQWSAARSPGDLDVLIGVNMARFKKHNPSYKGVDNAIIAHLLTSYLKEHLWPRTANQQIGTGHYEVTWYVNVGAEDIRDINPYAAYNITKDTWTVRPPTLAPDWGTQYFPPDWWAQIGREKKYVQGLVGEFLRARATYLTTRSRAAQVNAATTMLHNARLAAQWFEDIHSGRREAFSPQGAGYRDWHNFRWQAHKRNGVIPVVHALAQQYATAQEESDLARYGTALASTEQALATASLIEAHLNQMER